MRVYLVRHGQTAWNVGLKAQGHTDEPLDEVGLEQARRLGEAFARTQIAEVWSSDLSRAARTAEQVASATGAKLKLLPDLRERGFGEWEGQPFPLLRSFIESAQEVTGLPSHEVTPPGGESLLNVWHRLENVAKALQQMHDPVVVVSHGGTTGLLLTKLIAGQIETARAFRFGNASLTELERRLDGGFSLIRFNDVRHLGDNKVMSGGADGATK